LRVLIRHNLPGTYLGGDVKNPDVEWLKMC
jgi:hypothetical protein